jgi:hypothetical protein
MDVRGSPYHLDLAAALFYQRSGFEGALSTADDQHPPP